MASIAILLGGAIANAVAFTGGQAIYHSVSGSNAELERERHDKAVEELNKATAKWSQQRLKTLDFVNRSLKLENQRGAITI